MRFTGKSTRLRPGIPQRPTGKPKHPVLPIAEPIILVLHFCNKDGDQGIRLINWIAELDPKIPYEILLACDEATDRRYRDPIRETALKTFKAVRFFSYPTPETTSWPQAPNQAWQAVARYFGDFGPLLGRKSWLWLETDAIPVKAGWLDELCRVYVEGKKPFMGHIVEGMGHFNGVAIYPWNVSYYCPEAIMIRNVAWDSFMGEQMNRKGTMKALTHNAWKQFQHVWAVDDNGKPTNDSSKPQVHFNSLDDFYRWCDGEACLFHRCKDGSLIPWLRKIKLRQEKPETWNVPKHGFEAKAMTPVPEPVEKPIEYKGKADILIVTFGKPTFRPASGKTVSDAEWLLWCLRAMQKHFTGWHELHIVVPRADRDIIRSVTMDFDVTLHLFDEPAGKGMLAHMHEVCCADLWCKDADIIMHFDPDCIFHTPTTVDEYVVQNKPVMLKRSYTGLTDPESKAVSDCIQWKPVVEKALGFETNTYTMCRHPSCYPRGLYPEFRKWVAQAQQMPFKQYVLSQKNEFPQTFAEFPTLGAFAWEFFKDTIHWIDIDVEKAPKDRQKTYWSHSGIDDRIKAEMDGFIK